MSGCSTCSRACWISLSTTVGIPQLPGPAARLGYAHAAHRTGPVGAVEQTSPDVGPLALEVFPRLLHRASIDAGAPLVGFDSFPRRRHVLLCQCLPQQVLWPPVRLVMPRRLCFITPTFRRGFTAPFRRSLRLRGLLMPCTSGRHTSSLSFSFGPSPGDPTTTTSADFSLRASPSPFQARGEISPGKNAILHRTTAAFTSPGPWPRELRSHMPARPGRRRLGYGSCTSAHGLRSTLSPRARSPSGSCASLASLWPARPGTCTPKIAPMLGAQRKRAAHGRPFMHGACPAYFLSPPGTLPSTPLT